MMARSLKQMTALAFAAGVAVLVNAAPAKAALNVTYNTSVKFTYTGDLVNAPIVLVNGPLTSTVQFGASILTYTGVAGSADVPTPADFGLLKLSGGTGTFHDLDFALTITQVAPPSTPPSATFTSLTLHGKVTAAQNLNNGELRLVFSSSLIQSLAISGPFGPGSVTYEVFQPAGGGSIPAANTGTGLSINGRITSVVPTPEPGAVALALTGLPLIGLVAWRRSRKSGI